MAGVYRKKRYSRKKRARRPRNKGQNPEVNKCVAVYLNPYSTATQHPKIPDGSRNYTLGASFRSQFAVTGQTIDVILIPTLTCFGCTHVTANNPFYWSTVTEATGESAFVPHQLNLTNPQGNLQNVTYEAWRGISFGMKVRTINNDQQNDGHYQAVRVKPCHPVAYINDRVEDLLPMNQIPSQIPIADVSTWPNDPTYSSGRIKDLIAKDFMLATEENEHPWVELFDNANVKKMDTSFDIVCLRLNGTATTNMLFDFYGNYEYCIRPGSALNMFQTLAPTLPPNKWMNVTYRKRLKTKKAAS
jgi:hypothetical protein